MARLTRWQKQRKALIHNVLMAISGDVQIEAK
jgi:hypothetical protein